jgi:hypothetical protein
VDSNVGISQTSADVRYYLNSITLDAITAPSGILSMNNFKIINLDTPTASSDAVTKAYVDSNVGISQTSADARYYLNTSTLDTITTPTASLSLNSQKITNLADAILGTDALNI